MFKRMSKATIIGNVSGLFICIPLYYFFGINAIVPVMVIYPIISFIVLQRAVSSISIPKVEVTYREAVEYGKEIIKSGFFICLQSLFSFLYIYLIRLFLRDNGGLTTVGLFSAGIILVNRYVGLVFSSMSTEYYPRLSAISDNESFNNAINMQIRRSIILLTPLIIAMISLMPLIVKILFSDEFLSIIGMCIFLLASVGFRVIEWCFGFSFIARGRTTILFVNELSFKIYTLILSILFYYTWDILGIGIAYLLSELIFSIQSYLLVNKMWKFEFQSDCIRIFNSSIVCIIICLCFNYWMKGYVCYLISGVLLLIMTFRLYNYLYGLKNV